MNENPSLAEGLADRLKRRTHALHATAERTGVTAQILKGRASRRGYGLLLGSLLPVYEAMERQFEELTGRPGVGRLAQPEVYRRAALQDDLRRLFGDDWRRELPLPPEADQYAERVRAVAGGGRLVAHAYVRYLGDLNGGQALARLLGRSLALGPDALAFYNFAAIDDLATFRTQYRTAIDDAGRELADLDAVVEEAAVAFQMNIDLSEAVQRLQDAADARTAVESKAALA